MESSYIEVRDKNKLVVGIIECNHNVEEMRNNALLYVILKLTRMTVKTVRPEGDKFKIKFKEQGEEVVFEFKALSFSPFVIVMVCFINCLKDYVVANTLVRTSKFKIEGDFKAASELFFQEQKSMDVIDLCYKVLNTITENVEEGLH